MLQHFLNVLAGCAFGIGFLFGQWAAGEVSLRVRVWLWHRRMGKAVLNMRNGWLTKPIEPGPSRISVITIDDPTPPSRGN